MVPLLTVRLDRPVFFTKRHRPASYTWTRKSGAAFPAPESSPAFTVTKGRTKFSTEREEEKRWGTSTSRYSVYNDTAVVLLSTLNESFFSSP